MCFLSIVTGSPKIKNVTVQCRSVVILRILVKNEKKKGGGNQWYYDQIDQWYNDKFCDHYLIIPNIAYIDTVDGCLN